MKSIERQCKCMWMQCVTDDVPIHFPIEMGILNSVHQFTNIKRWLSANRMPINQSMWICKEINLLMIFFSSPISLLLSLSISIPVHSVPHPIKLYIYSTKCCIFLKYFHIIHMHKVDSWELIEWIWIWILYEHPCQSPFNKIMKCNYYAKLTV